MRRFDGGHRVAPRPWPATSTTPAVQINAVGTALRGRPSWDQFDDMTTMAARDAAGLHVGAHRSHAGRTWTPRSLYDGFSVLTIVWLEAMGFCGRGRERALH